MHGLTAAIHAPQVWGRIFNGGQTCVAPEYVLVPREQLDDLALEMQAEIERAYGDDPSSSLDLGGVISAASARRIGALLTGHGGKICCGGVVHPERRYVAPTLVLAPREDSPLMCEEVFGPVLCLIPYDTLDDAIAYVKRKPTPLSLCVPPPPPPRVARRDLAPPALPAPPAACAARGLAVWCRPPRLQPAAMRCPVPRCCRTPLCRMHALLPSPRQLWLHLV